MIRKDITEGIVNPEQLEKEFEAIMSEVTEEELGQLYQGEANSYKVDDIVKGTVVRIQGEAAVIDVGCKSEGFVGLDEFGDEKPEIGTEIQVYLEAIEDEQGLIVLSKRKADRALTWQKLIEEKHEGDLVKGRITRKIKGGLLVDIGVPVFLPASQVDIRRVADVADYVGMEVQCEIIKIDIERRNIVVSRRKLLEKERESKKSDLLETLQVGDVRTGVVKNITDFGAFIDLGGIDGLLHITDMSWGRVTHPSEIVSLDQEIEVKVLDFNRERERISVGLKQKSDNPWVNVAERYPKETIVNGEVVNIMPYGAFVKLEEGVEGLVHVSEMSWTRQINHPSEVVNVGEGIEVVVLDVNESKREISLGMKQTEVNPWTLVEEKYPIGKHIAGKVRNITGYGAFVELEDGIDGLLHVSDMSWTKKVTHPSSMLKKGDDIEAVVLSVDPVRKRVALGMKQLSEDPWETEIPAKFVVGDIINGEVTKITSFGVFVEIGDDLEGLLHVSELAHRKVEKPEEIVNVGDKIEVKIINVDIKDRKIGLSLKAMDSDAEVFAEAVQPEAVPEVSPEEAPTAEFPAPEAPAEEETPAEEASETEANA